MRDAHDHSKLKWIRTELDSLLSQSSRALEDYAEGIGGKELISDCIEKLHQVRGTLQLMQLYGAAMLAEEMEMLAIAIRDDQVNQQEAATETLMLGLVHLPSYLEKLERGARDIPLLVLPMLNELRAARDASLLSEVALFAPELEQILGSDKIVGSANPELQELARRLRLKYHQGLIKWYRDMDVDDGLKTIGSVLSELSQHAGTDKVSRLFKAGWAVTEGLREEGGSKPGFAFKELFGKLDRELKRIIDVGEEIAAEAPTNELLKNFLYYVASSSSDIPLINQIRQEFGLKQGFFSKEEINLERESLQAFDQDLLGSLRIAIGTDLTAIKDGLDLFIRSAENDVARLRELEVPTRKVADTLGMIGQGALRERLKRQADWLKTLADPESQVDEQMLMSMAGDILFIETSLDNLASLKQKSGLAGTGEADDARLLPEGEFEKLTDSVMHEAEVDMAKNRDAIINYINGPQAPELLEEVPARFKAVAGAFTIMNQEQASGLLRGLSRFVERTLLVGGDLPPAEDLNRFADAMTSVEYFMEGVTEGRGAQPEILKIAEKALIELGVIDAAADAAGAEEASEQGAAWEAEDQAASLPAEPVLVSEAVEAGDRPTEISTEQAAADEIDPEILEIFLEEAAEELDSIQTYLPRWCSDTQDSESLATTRRSFHTLKGSGRLVGALVIGEFAWSIENLLNRVIEKTVEVSADLLALLQEAKEMLPRLIENQRSGSSIGDGVESLMARAFDLAGGGMPRPEAVPAFAGEAAGLPDQEQIELPAESFDSAEVETQWPEQASDDMEGLAMDDELADIYLPETRGHIEELNGFISDCRQDPEKCDLKGANISRALHTLHGSAEMADVDAIAAVSAALESYIKNLIASDNRLADESVLSLIEDCTACFSAVLDAINHPDCKLPDWEALLDRIDEQALQSQLAAEALEAVPPEEQFEVPDDEVSDTAAIAELGDEAEDVVTLPTQRKEKAPALSIAGIEYDEIPGDEDLIEIFMEEARELLESVEQSLQDWRANSENLAPLSELQRTLHTLKGGARLSGVMAMGDLSHAFETLLSEVDPQNIDKLSDIMELSQLVSDRLAEQIEDIGNGPRVRRSDDLIRQLERLSGGAEVETTEPGPPLAATPEALQEEEAPDLEAEEPQAVVFASADKPAVEQKSARGRREQIRVQADLLDKLVNNAGEVSIYRARLEQQNNTLGFNLKELEQTVDRLRSQLRNLDIETEAQILFRYEREKEEREAPETAFDPLEMDRFSTIQQLSRSLLETVNDLTNINGYLEDLNKETETLLLQQARVATDLQDGLLHTRMVPFAQQVPRLQRVVRQTAASLGKKAELYVKGAEGELDRGVLDRMIGPLEHVLRNAVSHGIESPDRRKDLGKQPTGSISLNLIREGNDIIVSVTDDGAGLDTEAIRKQAIESGLLDAAAEVPDSVVIQFVLEHGFSTKREVTQISGRGVGLDVVIKEVKNLGGSLDIDSTRGEGTSFTIRLPLTLAISDALLVELDDEIYAVPHISIEGVVRVSKTELLNSYDGRSASFNYADHDYRVRYLGALLNTGQVNLSDQRKWYPLLLVRAGEHRIALQVDGLLGNRQIVVKSVGPQISSVRWISGGTILGDGRVALILDMTALVRMDATHTIPSQLELPPAIHAPPQNVVMVVDDSITVRKVTGRVLERNGMKVITAKDGVDAVAQLQEQLPDVMLLDIEMPRMDGYELARHMRNTDELKSIPIIMITSRTGDKHRQLAMELGVRRYLGKPYQEAELLDNIYSVLAEESP